MFHGTGGEVSNRHRTDTVTHRIGYFARPGISPGTIREGRSAKEGSEPLTPKLASRLLTDEVADPSGLSGFVTALRDDADVDVVPELFRVSTKLFPDLGARHSRIDVHALAPA